MASILTVNAGSSSLKFALFDVADGQNRRVWGQVERIGGDARLRWRNREGRETTRQLGHGCDSAGALDAVLDAIGGLGTAAIVGHRIVHGGSDFVEPRLIDADSLARLEALDPLAPLHQPHNLAAIRRFFAVAPELPQVGVFDTGFHARMPPVAKRLGLPQAFHQRGIRRYGFHGLSYQHAASQLRERVPAARRAIVAHLGNGASLCALRDGRSVETTLGFSALDGLLMGTRCGSLDPGVILHLLDVDRMDLSELEDLLYRRSGLLGVSGLSQDMRDLLASDDADARAAVDLFVYRVIRETGALYSVLGGLDALVFTGGIGENAAAIRHAIAEGLAWTGLVLDPDANRTGAADLHAAASALPCLIVHCDEEQVIADACRNLLQ
ncbi:MAG TPA: acetate/propionate family kinase [Xanthomonadaceae bacterium]|nr:acetate/propionate family kinase [Xanthomonadaceae bacterium]